MPCAPPLPPAQYNCWVALRKARGYFIYIPLLPKHASALICLLTYKNKPFKWKWKKKVSPVPFPNSKTEFVLLQKEVRVKKVDHIFIRSNHEEWWPFTPLSSFFRRWFSNQRRYRVFFQSRQVSNSSLLRLLFR